MPVTRENVKSMNELIDYINKLEERIEKLEKGGE
jgi:hypothetical protein